MKFEKLGIPERKLLLKALSFNVDKLKCQYCKEKVSYKNCCICPPTKTKKLATILCNSPMCMIWYLDETERNKLNSCCKKTKQKTIKKIFEKIEAKIKDINQELKTISPTFEIDFRDFEEIKREMIKE